MPERFNPSPHTSERVSTKKIDNAGNLISSDYSHWHHIKKYGDTKEAHEGPIEHEGPLKDRKE